MDFEIFILGFVILWNAAVWLILLWSLYTYCWPQTIGRITLLDIEEVTGADSYDEYEVIVEYSYSVKGNTYSSKNYFINGPDRIHTKEKATEKLRELSLGQELTVYFDYFFPKFSVQKKGIPNGVVMGAIVGFVVLIMVWGKVQT